MNFLAPFEQGDIEVRNTARPDLAFRDEAAHFTPGVLDRHPRVVRPVELVEIDPLDAEAPERRVALLAHGVRAQAALRLAKWVRVRGAQAAFSENERPLPCRHPSNGAADNLFGVPAPVYGGRIDPIDPYLDGVAQRPH
jgi:hypothetical protein